MVSASRSCSKRKAKSSHKEKLASFVQQTIQKSMFEDDGGFSPYISLIEAPLTRELTDQIEYYED
jgi:hypothetical protein